MNIPTATDDGDPQTSTTILRFSSFLLLTVALLFSSCEKKKKETIVAKPAIDSARIKQQQKQHADSVAKLTTVKKKKKIYLTFDDGPNKGTMNVLNTVKEENVPVTFFIVGQHVFDSRDQRAVWEILKADSSVELCNHSYSHAHNRYSKFYSDIRGVIEDMQRNQEQLGFNNRIVRMPGRNAWRFDSAYHNDIKESKLAIDSVQQAGFSVLGWDIEWTFDHKTLEPDADTDLLLRRIQNMLDAKKTKLADNIVVLAHDQSFQKEEAIEKLRYFFQQLKSNPDYQLVIVSEYPGIMKK